MSIPVAGRVISVDAHAVLHASRRYRAQVFFQQCRHPAALRRSSTAAATNAPIDSYIPFDGRLIAPNTHSVVSVSPGELQTEGSPAQRQRSGSKDVTRPDVVSAPDNDAAAVYAVSLGGRDTARIVLDSQVREGNVLATKAAAQEDMPPAKETIAKTAVSPSPKTAREQSRLARKMRRIEAGTHNRDSQIRLQQDATQVDSVLAKLDELKVPETSVWAGFEDNATPAKVRKPLPAAEDLSLQQKTERPAKPDPKPKKEAWQIQKRVAEQKFGETGWQPRKRLSPDTLEGIRALHASDQTTYTTEMLSAHFKITPEAIRRILKSKWQPNEEEAEDRRARWERRGAKKWQSMAEQGMRAPAKWRAMGVGGEEGLREERLPARRKKRRDEDGLSWDDVVGGLPEHGEERSRHDSLADRLL